MAQKSLKTINKTRTDTYANFTASNIILKKGEMAFESDTKCFKIGDGVTPWNSLEYMITPNSGIINNLTTNIVTAANKRQYLSLTFSMPSNDLINQKIHNGSAVIKVYLYKISKKGSTKKRESYNKWVHPTNQIGVFSKDFYDSISQNTADKEYTMSYQAESEARVATKFEFGEDFFEETSYQQDYYIVDFYDLSELARQMVFFCDNSSVCPADFVKPVGEPHKIQNTLKPRIQGYNYCHVIGKREIGRTVLKYRFQIVVGDKVYWSDTIKIIYTYDTRSKNTTFGIRVE